jgi:hypothetical protein
LEFIKYVNIENIQFICHLPLCLHQTIFIQQLFITTEIDNVPGRFENSRDHKRFSLILFRIIVLAQNTEFSGERRSRVFYPFKALPKGLHFEEKGTIPIQQLSIDNPTTGLDTESGPFALRFVLCEIKRI